MDTGMSKRRDLPLVSNRQGSVFCPGLAWLGSPFTSPKRSKSPNLFVDTCKWFDSAGEKGLSHSQKPLREQRKTGEPLLLIVDSAMTRIASKTTLGC